MDVIIVVPHYVLATCYKEAYVALISRIDGEEVKGWAESRSRSRISHSNLGMLAGDVQCL
jgi:hypothetical protein